jgi:hypothetical protein
MYKDKHNGLKFWNLDPILSPLDLLEIFFGWGDFGDQLPPL